MRTQDEIVSRITESRAKASLFNFESDVLIDARQVAAWTR